MAVRNDFEAAVAALWARLDLGPPRFDQPGRVRLRVEDFVLDLVDDGRGVLEIEGSAGKLSRDGPRRADQIRKILRTGVGLLVGNDAGVFLKQALDGSMALAVHSAYRLDFGRVDLLVRKIEDVLRVMEYYAGELKSANVPQRLPRASAEAGVDQAVIFRP